MKIKHLLAYSLAASLFSSASFAQSVTTDPVGVVTLNIKGTQGAGSSAISFLSVPLHAPIDSQAALIAVDGDLLTFNSDWTPGEFANTHFVQIVSGANEGASSTIVSNTATTLTTGDDLSGFVSAGDIIAIRKYTTISDIFGPNNEAGLVGAASAGLADNILIPNPSGGFDIYYYKNAGLIGGTGWRSSVSPSIDESAQAIPFGSGFLVRRVAVADLQVAFTGSVIANDSILPIFSGVNWSAPVAPITYTIAEFFGPNNEAGLVGAASAGLADNILIPNASGGYDIFYYKNAGLIGGTGWRSSTSPSVNEAGRILVEPGGLFLINRSQGGDFNLIESNPVAAN